MDTPPATPSPAPARRRGIVQDYLRPLAVWLALGGVAVVVLEIFTGWPGWTEWPVYRWGFVAVAAAPVWPFLYGPPASDWWCRPAVWGVLDAVSLALFLWILFSRSPRKTLWLALHGLVWWTLVAGFAICFVVASC